MDERRIDLSALDPGRDPERFERMIRSVLARAGEPGSESVPAALVARGRIAFAIAAAAAALVWAPLLATRGGSASEARTSDPVALVSAWAEQGAIPAGVDVYRALGVNDAR
jgi:hypothetical protein